MEKINRYSLVLVILGIIIYLVNFYILLKPKLNPKVKKKNKKKKTEIMEVDYLVRKFGIPKEYLLTARIFKKMAIINAFIISLVSTIIMFLPIHMSLQFLVGFALLFGLIYSLYEILGRSIIKEIKKMR